MTGTRRRRCFGWAAVTAIVAAAGCGGGEVTGGASDARPGVDGVAAIPDDDGYLKNVVPVLWFTVDSGRQLNRTTAVPGQLKVVEQHDGAALLTNLDGKAISLATKVAMRIRGFSSAHLYAQKPYSVEFQDAAGKDVDLPLLGMPKESDWVLSSCYSDKTCLRNAVSYSLARDLHAQGGVWAPRTRFAEVYIDGNYRGVYLVVEKPKASKVRMNLGRPAIDATAGDITGAYMFSSDGNKSTYAANPADPQREWYDDLGMTRWEHRFPDREDITPAQKAYLIKAVNGWETGLLAGADWRTGIDARSWMDYFTLAELSNNTDAFFRSWYVHKHADAAGGKFGLGPVWDFDLAYGNVNYNHRYCVNNSMVATLNAPFAAIAKNVDFSNQLRCHWQTLRKEGGALDIKRIEAKIDAFAAHIKTAKARDGARWNNIGKFVWPNNYVGATWADEVAYLKYWIRRRLIWLDGGGIKGTCASIPAPPPVPATPQPAPIANDMRVAQAQVSPPQFRPGIDPAAFIPLEGSTTDPKWSCSNVSDVPRGNDP